MSEGIVERDGRWVVTIEGEGGKPLEKTFGTYRRALAWKTRATTFRPKEASASSSPAYSGDTTRATLGDLLTRYGREVSAHKRGAKEETYRVNKLAQRSVAKIIVGKLTSKDLADFRNGRLAEVGNSSVRSEMSMIRRTLELARREWGFEIPTNVAGLVTLPKPSQARTRRLDPGEYEKLERALKGHALVWAFVRLAIETACRRGELLALTWRNVDLARRMIFLPLTKNGQPRTVPLTDGAVEVLEGMKATGEKVFPIDQSALRWAWDKACKDAGLKDLRIHDLRHEGVSRLFEMGLSVPEVGLISGHKTLGMLFRYTQLRPADLARKLRGRKANSDISVTDGTGG